MDALLNDLAAYPQTVDEVTADALLRYETVAAYAHMTETQALCRAAFRPTATDADKRRYFDAEMVMAQQFAVLFVLRNLKEFAPAAVADDVAKRLHAAWDDGSCFGDFLFSWLVEYEIDPEAVFVAATNAMRDAA
jgi:hypothetical protein